MSIPAVNVFGPSDWYRTIRDQIQHEDNLIVQRLAWLMAAQSFFFTGYAIVANATPPPRNPLSAKQLDLLFDIIPAVAFISDVLIYCSVIAGVLALYRLRRAYATHVAPVGNFPEIHQGSRLTRWLGFAPPILLPLVFLIAWLIVWSRAHL
jgi:NADH:ubiquinone oxidoreductase subunit 5 (subunit L)/multisubunit Na+/H+ antiporter MnhA subunit